jgi:Trypsin-like peptidase domain
MLQTKRLAIKVPSAALLGMLLLLAPIGQTQAQVTTNVLLRVLIIQVGTTFGSSFTIDVDGRQYLITAKHLVAGLQSEDTVQIRKNDAWIPVKVKVFRCDDPIDIAVLVPPAQMTVTFPLEPVMQGIRLGQDMFFIGFPYGLFTSGQSLSLGYPIAFIKKAIMSASTYVNGVATLFLDGHNNPGFSGGPIVYRDLDRTEFVYKVAGVVSGFRHDMTPVLKPEEIKPEEVTPQDIAQARILWKDGRLFRLNDMEELVKFNTGIVLGYKIEHALDLIHKNPIGPQVSETFKP